MVKQWLLLAALGVPTGFAPVLAQTPAQRTVLEAFRDSLDRVGDSLGLSQVEARMVAALRRDRADAFEHLRLGFLALRQAELGATRYFDDAASEFETVTRLSPEWGYGWFGLGLAEFGLAATGATGTRRASAEAPYARASVALARAAMTDGRFADMVVEEAFQARRERQPERVSTMLVALRVAGRPPARNPSVLAGLGRLEREFGDPQAALRVFDSWLPHAGRQRGLALLELARTRFLLGRLDGVAPYFEGSVYDDSVTVHAYRHDIELIGSRGELEEFDRAAGPNRTKFLRGFWGRRDAADLRVPGERLREHYRRLYHARRTYPLYLPGRVPEYIAAVPVSVDDRGLMYIRHGEPDDRVELTTLGVEPNESWRYDRAEGDLIIHFVARHDPEVFRLVESLLDVGETVEASSPATRDLVSRSQEVLLRSREQISPLYRRERRATPDRRSFLLAERAMSRQSLRAATTTDSYHDRFSHRLPARVDFGAFGLDSTGARLYVAFAVPFVPLRAAWLGEGIEYPLRVRLSGFSEAGDRLVTLDTVARPLTHEILGERWLAGTLSVPIPPGRMRLRIAFQDGDSVGTLLPIRSFEVLPTGKLEMSDLVVGVQSQPWQARLEDGERVAMAPLGFIQRSQRAELAYEVTVPPGAALQTQLTVIRADDRAGVVSNERLTPPVGLGRQLVRHVLDIHKLKPGLYRIEVTVTDGLGGRARRSREFEVR